MDAVAVLREGFGRLPELVRPTVEGLDASALTWRPGPGANTLSWLVWHLVRQQDAQVAALAGTDEDWTSGGWAERAGLPLDSAVHGYGMDPAQVELVDVPAELLLGYAASVHRSTMDYLGRISGPDLEEVVDHDWDPPVTRGVRLVSVLDDALQHLGQAAYVRGLWDRR